MIHQSFGGSHLKISQIIVIKSQRLLLRISFRLEIEV